MRIVVLGAGYAGLTLVRRLERTLPEEHEIVLVNDSDTHLVQHEIHRAIRRPAVAEDIVVPLSDVTERATIRVARVTRVDPDARTIHLTDAPSDGAAREYDGDERTENETAIRIDVDTPGEGNDDADGGEETDAIENAERKERKRTLDYDVCAICLGAETDFQGVRGVTEHATPLKRLGDAERIRTEFRSVLSTGGRVVVCGAGLSGVQVAGELAALAREEESDVEIVLTEALERIAPAFPAEFSDAVREELEERGVRIRTGAPVERVSDGSVTLEDGEILAEQVIWTGGIRGPAALDGERPVVRNTLEIGENTFVLGDAARVIDADGEAVPASAQSAVREARLVAKNVTQIVAQEGRGGFRPRLAPFNFDSPGWLVSVGDGAVAQVGPTVLRGRAAKALKTTVGAGYLTSVGAIGNAAGLAREELSGSD